MPDHSYVNVAELARGLCLDAEMIGAVEEAVGRQAIVRQLMAMRAVRGLSQSDVAKTMGCSQSRVSKIEHSADVELRHGDLCQYARAVGCELEAWIRPKDLEPADEVKCLAFAVNDRLSRMANLAQDDEVIAKGVAEFFFEAFVDFSMILGRAASALPKNPDGSPRIAVRLEMQQDAAAASGKPPSASEEDAPAGNPLRKRPA